MRFDPIHKRRHPVYQSSKKENGAFILNNPKCNERAEILQEKGTNRSKFFRVQMDKYMWVGFRNSYLLSELNATYLWVQLEVAD